MSNCKECGCALEEPSEEVEVYLAAVRAIDPPPDHDVVTIVLTPHNGEYRALHAFGTCDADQMLEAIRTLGAADSAEAVDHITH